ncbi:MAG: sensor histidine kinase [Salibacteraceae bacterium]
MFLAQEYAPRPEEDASSTLPLESLQQVADPHFLHNCLDSLYQLIQKDQVAASTYMERLSQLHAYVLEHFAKPTVAMREELAFIRSYYELNRLRFGNHLQLKIMIPEKYHQLEVPPMSLQLLLENSIKHNRISAEHPLVVTMVYSPKTAELVVANNLQELPSGPRSASTGVGHWLLTERYKMAGKTAPRISRTEHRYEVRLPLLKRA